MRAIIVDDEPLMIRKFVRLTADIEDLFIVGEFDHAGEAEHFVASHPVEAAFLDVELPDVDGIELARRLRVLRSDIMIVFITAYDEYIHEANEINGDHYIIKPYTKTTLENVVAKLRLLSVRQQKKVYIQMFGRFMIRKDGIPVKLSGKAKEILALVVTKRGKEISNEEIYSTIWEGRPYSNANMSVYYNALRRLKDALCAAGIGDILVSTPRGQMVNAELFDCDYYAWREKKGDQRGRFEGEFLSEYSWGEYILATILQIEQWNQ